VTINWFELGTSVRMNAPDWPALTDFDGDFVSLGIYLLGPYGTCAQRLGRVHFGMRRTDESTTSR
jgi:hypothetical protein